MWPSNPSCACPANRAFPRPWVVAGIVFLALAFSMGPASAQGVEELLFQAMDLNYRGDVEAAARAFEKVLAVEPENPTALTFLGILNVKREKTQEARTLLKKAVQAEPENVEARLWLGLLDLWDFDLENALKILEEAARLDPNRADAYHYMGTVYAFRHNPIQAIDYLKKARDAAADEADTRFRLARAFDQAGLVHNALLEYRKTLELNPRHTKALNSMGWIYYNHGDTPKALELWNQALSINPKDQETILNLAKTYNILAFEAFKAGKREEAAKYWKKTLSIHPGNKAAKYYLQRTS